MCLPSIHKLIGYIPLNVQIQPGPFCCPVMQGFQNPTAMLTLMLVILYCVTRHFISDPAVLHLLLAPKQPLEASLLAYVVLLLLSLLYTITLT